MVLQYSSEQTRIMLKQYTVVSEAKVSTGHACIRCRKQFDVAIER